jgi:Flp pilus assembly protein TadG
MKMRQGRWLRTILQSCFARGLVKQPGQVIVIFALASIPVMGFVGLSIDGGNILAQRRIAQNGADAGALAAIRDFIQSPSGNPLSTAQDYATRNAASGNQLQLAIQADYINNAGTVETSRSSATGVRVTVTKRFPTYFISILGISEFTVSAKASGKIQQWTPSGGPFLVCADGLLNTDGLNDNTSTPSDYLAGGNGILNFSTNPPTIRPEALAQEFFVHGSKNGQNDGDCGWEDSNNFKGVTDPASSASCPTAPCWIPFTNGNTSGPVDYHIAGIPGCSGNSDSFAEGCVAILPVTVRKNSPEDNCTGTDPANNMCVRAWVPFQLRTGPTTANGCAGSNCHIGRIIETVLLINSPGVDCTPPCTGALVAKLSE